MARATDTATLPRRARVLLAGAAVAAIALLGLVVSHCVRRPDTGNPDRSALSQVVARLQTAVSDRVKPVVFVDGPPPTMSMEVVLYRVAQYLTRSGRQGRMLVVHHRNLFAVPEGVVDRALRAGSEGKISLGGIVPVPDAFGVDDQRIQMPEAEVTNQMLQAWTAARPEINLVLTVAALPAADLSVKLASRDDLCIVMYYNAATNEEDERCVCLIEKDVLAAWVAISPVVKFRVLDGLGIDLPGCDTSAMSSKDFARAFAAKYVLITKENVRKIQRPRLPPSDGESASTVPLTSLAPETR